MPDQIRSGAQIYLGPNAGGDGFTQPLRSTNRFDRVFAAEPEKT